MQVFFRHFLEGIKTDHKNIIIDIAEQILSWPESWIRIDYKKYSRFLQQGLRTNLNLVDLHFRNILVNRNSFGEGLQEDLNFEQVSNLLYLGAGKKPNQRRNYASAGGRYPLEVYLLVNKDILDLKQGVYHYNVEDNCLEYMWENFKKNYVFCIPQDKNQSSIYIVTTAIIERTSRKYGRLAMKHVYLETGILMQNFSLLAAEMNIAHSILNADDFLLEELLDIDGYSEFVTGFLAVGFSMKKFIRI